MICVLLRAKCKFLSARLLRNNSSNADENTHVFASVKFFFLSDFCLNGKQKRAGLRVGKNGRLPCRFTKCSCHFYRHKALCCRIEKPYLIRSTFGQCHEVPCAFAGIKPERCGECELHAIVYIRTKQRFTDAPWNICTCCFA